MKFKIKYLSFLVLIAALFTTSAASSQSMLQGQVSEDLKEAASRQVEMWSGELALSAKQRKLMEDKIVEFSIKKNALLQSKMREEVKTRKLKELQVLENRDMRDILTKPQYDRYLMLLRKQIQEKEELY